jgi:hypothetical protein
VIDYMTSADRLGTSLAAKRAASIATLRSRGKYIADIGCTFVPRSAAQTDVALTFEEYRREVKALAQAQTQEVMRWAA